MHGFASLRSTVVPLHEDSDFPPIIHHLILEDKMSSLTWRQKCLDGPAVRLFPGTHSSSFISVSLPVPGAGSEGPAQTGTGNLMSSGMELSVTVADVPNGPVWHEGGIQIKRRKHGRWMLICCIFNLDALYEKWRLEIPSAIRLKFFTFFYGHVNASAVR